MRIIDKLRKNYPSNWSFNRIQNCWESSLGTVRRTAILEDEEFSSRFPRYHLYPSNKQEPAYIVFV